MNRLFALLVRLYPREFRQRFAAEILEQVQEEGEAARSRGRAARLRFSMATALDLARCAAAERWRRSWVDAGAKANDRHARTGMDGWTKDVRHSLRTLGRSPGFTAITVGTLALAMGVNAGIFSVVDTVILDPLPYAHGDRLVYIGGTAPGSDFAGEFALAPEFYVHFKERSRLLEDVAIYNSFTATLRAGERAERVRMSVPTMSLFSTLGATPLLGRLPIEQDADQVALISHALWVTWFGSDPAVVGQTYRMAGGDRTVIGVLPPDFRFPRDDVMLWIPVAVRPEGIVPGRFGGEVGGLVARVSPGATPRALAVELAALARELPGRFGGSADYRSLIERYRPVVRPLAEQLVGDISRPLWLLLGSVAVVLLIACANVANLFIVRAERRQHDLAIRRAIGAGSAQLFRSQMAEAVVIAVCAGVFAVGLAWVSVPLVLRAAPAEVPRLADVRITAPTLLFTLGVSLLSALLCGLIPALRAARPNLLRLRDGSRGSTQRRRWGQDALVVAQTALALVLLIGAGLLVRSFLALRSVDPGYDTRDVFTFQIAPEEHGLTDAAAFARFHAEFMGRIAVLPGVESVGVVENVPLNEGVREARFRTTETTGPGGPVLGYTWAGGDYFATMGIEVLAGRAFTAADHTTSPGNVIISRSAAALLWPGLDHPIGRRLQREGLASWETVVGVVDDVMQYTFRDAPQPLVYFPLVGQDPGGWVISSPAYVVKTARAAHMAPEIRALAQDAAPGAPVYREFTMAGLAADSMVQLSFTMLMLGITSLLALFLGTVGLYGVLSYVVAERTREIGVRMALGAHAPRVRAMVVLQGVRVVLAGVVLGAAAALAATRALGGLLFDTRATDAATFAAMSAAMLLAGLLASYIPARRASGVDPIRSLRGD